MHDDIAVVHEDPVRALVSLYLLARVSGFAKLLFHIVGHSLNLVSVGTTRDEEVISQNGYLADVDHADIFAFFIFQGRDGQFYHFVCLTHSFSPFLLICLHPVIYD